MPLTEHHPERRQQPRRRGHRSRRPRGDSLARRFNVVEGVLALIAAFSALWLLWPDGVDRRAEYSARWEERHQQAQQIPMPATEPDLLILPYTAASVSISSKVEVVGTYGPSDPLQMRPRLAKVARLMPEIGAVQEGDGGEAEAGDVLRQLAREAGETVISDEDLPDGENGAIEAIGPGQGDTPGRPPTRPAPRSGGAAYASTPAADGAGGDATSITFEEQPFEIVSLPPHNLERANEPLPPESLERLEERLRAPPGDPGGGPHGDVVDQRPAWLRYAVAPPPLDGRPMIAIVVDDLGLNRYNTAALNDLPGPLTLAFLPYAGELGRQTQAARDAGHELIVHMPMEPIGTEWPGPNALFVELTPEEFERRLLLNLEQFGGYVGINNHMGSQLTQDRRRMRIVMEELNRRELLFLDSKTSPLSIGAHEAQADGVPFAIRDVFLDNVIDVDAIEDQLAVTEGVALRNGSAIAIAHPHNATLDALAGWLPTLEARGFALVPLSTVVARRACIDGLLADGCAPFGVLERVAGGTESPRT